MLKITIKITHFSIVSKIVDGFSRFETSEIPIHFKSPPIFARGDLKHHKFNTLTLQLNVQIVRHQYVVEHESRMTVE